MWWKMGLLPQPWCLKTVARSPQTCQIIVKNRFGPKVMSCVWWNFEDVIPLELVPKGRALDADLYSQQLKWVHEILRRIYPALFKRNRVLLLQDTAISHTARKTTTKIQELGGIELLSHPTYSPDLEPSDYYLFRSIAISCMEEISKTLKLCKWLVLGLAVFATGKPPYSFYRRLSGPQD